MEMFFSLNCINIKLKLIEIRRKTLQIISSFNVPNINYFGVNSSSKVGKIAENFHAKKALIVTDVNLPKVGVPDIIKYNLEESGIEAEVWGGIHPNPRDYDVEAGVKFYNEGNFDIIVGVGGGSAMDGAKAIRIIVDNGGKISDYEGVDKFEYRKTPLIEIATTAGTSSEANKLSVITNTQIEGVLYKMGISGWKVVADASINDPLLTTTLDKFYTAGTGMDAFTHALEAITSIDSTPFSDVMGYSAIKIISRWITTAVQEPNNIEARTNMMHAVLFAGLAFNTALLGISHSLAHPIGTYYDVHHGMSNAIILPYVCRFNFNEAMDKLAMIAEAMGVDTSKMSTIEAANKAIDEIEKLLVEIDAPHKLSELGVSKDKIERMSMDAYHDFCAGTNPRKATLEDFKTIYEAVI